MIFYKKGKCHFKFYTFYIYLLNLLYIKQLVIFFRWNATLHMLMSVSKMRVGIRQFILDHGKIGLNDLTTLEWSKLEKLIKILKPFDDITHQ